MKVFPFLLHFIHVFSSKSLFYLLKFRKSLFFSCFTKNIYIFAQNTKKYKYEQ